MLMRPRTDNVATRVPADLVDTLDPRQERLWAEMARALDALPEEEDADPVTLYERFGTLGSLIDNSVRPDRATLCLERLLRAVPDPRALAQQLTAEPRLVGNLVTLFAGSEYLSEILLRNPAHVGRLADLRDLAHTPSSGVLSRQALGRGRS